MPGRSGKKDATARREATVVLTLRVEGSTGVERAVGNAFASRGVMGALQEKLGEGDIRLVSYRVDDVQAAVEALVERCHRNEDEVSPWHLVLLAVRHAEALSGENVLRRVQAELERTPYDNDPVPVQARVRVVAKGRPEFGRLGTVKDYSRTFLRPYGVQMDDQDGNATSMFFREELEVVGGRRRRRAS